MKNTSKLLKQIGVFVLLVLLYLGNEFLNGDRDPDTAQRTPRTPTTQDDGQDHATAGSQQRRLDDIDDTQLIADSFEAKRSDVWVQASGEVARILSDDNEGSRHQRFLVELRNGHTVLIAHNIDLAPKVPVSRGDLVEFRGEFEWNDRGGVVHWTHHDPGGRKKGGWISHKRKTYD